MLPSPALTNEPSPADTERITSPNVSAGATSSGHQEFRQAEGAQLAARGNLTDTAQNVGARPIHPSERSERPQEVASQPSIVSPTPVHIPLSARLAEPRNGPGTPDQQLHPQGTAWSGDSSRGAPAYGLNVLDARLEADAEARSTKRLRLNPAPKDLRHVTRTGYPKAMLDHWTKQLDTHLRLCGGMTAPANDLDRLRYQYLRQACTLGDVPYAILHQLVCHWTIQQSAVTQNLPNVRADIVERAMNMLQIILRSNQGLTNNHLSWFARFPLPTLGDVLYFQDEIGDFLLAFAQHWQRLVESFHLRQVPLTAYELNIILRCRSEILQGTLFTVSRRTMQIPDIAATPLNELFVEDQASEARIAGDAGLPPEEIAVIRQDFYVRYRARVESIRRAAYGSGLERPNPGPQNGGVGFAHPNLPPSQGMQPLAAGAFTPPLAPTYTANQTIPSPGGFNGAHGSPAMQYSRQNGGPQGAFAGYVLPSDGPLHGPSLPRGNRNSGAHGGQVANAANNLVHPSEQVLNSSSWESNVRPQNPSPAHPANRIISAGVQPLASAPQQRPADSEHPRAQFSPRPLSLPQEQRFYTPPTGQAAPLNQAQVPPSQPSAASPMSTSVAPRMPTPVAAQQATQQAIPQQILQHEYPRSPYDWTSVSNGAHLPQLRSPKRRPIRSPIPSSRYFQYVTAFAVKPTHLPPEKGLRQLEFTLPKTDVDKIPTTSRDELTDLPVCYYFDGCHRYRLRLCMRPEEERDVKESDWAMSPSHWPAEFYPSINGKPILLPRKQHFRHDRPVDISSEVVEGANVIKVSFPKRAPNLQKKMTFFIAVEVVVTHRLEFVRSQILSSGYRPVEETTSEITRRLTLSDSDDVIAADNSLTISMTDPFTSVVLEIPVRGRDCKHLECFDLDVWLSTREGKPSKVKGQEPSLADNWGCPICGLDARPGSLVIDSFLQYARNKLVTIGNGKTKKIQVSADTRWVPVLELDLPEEDDVDDGPPATAPVQGSKTSTHTIVEILDD